MERIVIATSNAHKTAEIAAILGPDFEVRDLGAYPSVPQADETGTSFVENAVIKALAASRLLPDVIVADDSGLEVDALQGAPGVRSARYAGDHATDAENRAMLLRELRAVGARGKMRAARFRCVMALARDSVTLATFDGVVKGVIIGRERGTGGFGYDALFVPAGYCKTFAQMRPEEKNAISHRALALRAVVNWLRSGDSLQQPSP